MVCDEALQLQAIPLDLLIGEVGVEFGEVDRSEHRHNDNNRG